MLPSALVDLSMIWNIYVSLIKHNLWMVKDDEFDVVFVKGKSQLPDTYVSLVVQ